MRKSPVDPDLQSYKGTKVNKLTIQREFRRDGYIYAECDCECGNTKTLRRHYVLHGHTKSCGCLNRNRDRSNCGNRYYDKEAREARAAAKAPHQYTQSPRGGGFIYGRTWYAPRVLDDGGDGEGTGLLGPGESVRSSSD